MKIKNISHRIARVSLYCFFVLLTLPGCNDLLEKYPNSSISDNNFWSGESDALLALTGCYRFQTGWSHDDFATPQGLLYLDFAGGNGTEKENFSTLLASANTDASNSNIRSYWGNSYGQIAKYNTFLDNIIDCPMDEEKKKIWISEVESLRSYFLFYLTFHFKDVPMPLTSLTLEEANTIEQSSQSEVYAQVETDLKNAVNILPAERSSRELGRLTKGAVSVLLGRVYLAQSKWNEAASILKEIIDSDTYQLDRRNGEESYEKLFQIGGEYSPETIFCIMGVEDLYTNSRYQYLYPESNGGWHQFSPYNELVKEYFCSDGKSIEESDLYNNNDPFVNRDLRLYASIFLPPLGSYSGTEFNNIIYDSYKGANTSDYYSKFPLFNGYCPKKGTDPSVTNNLGSTPTYTPLMRYAEVLLSYLEAVNESNPSAIDQEMLDLTINDVRNRVSLPPILISDVSEQNMLREAIRKERRVELAFEGLRYFDVLRWGIAEKELNHTFTGVKLSNNPDDRNYRGSGATASPVDDDLYYQFEKRTWLPHNRYFPIPQNDLNVNKNLKQNDGYN